MLKGELTQRRAGRGFEFGCNRVYHIKEQGTVNATTSLQSSREEASVCQSTAYVVRGDREEKLMEDIAAIIPDGGRLRLVDLFGQEMVVEGSIQRINLLEHKILLTEE